MQPIVEEIRPIPQPEEDAQMSMEAEMTEMTDGEGNVQVSPLRSSTIVYPLLEIYAPTSAPPQFIETTSSAQPTETPIEGCALLQMLCAHYAPALSRVHRDCSTRDPDFNLLETILAHREAFGHRSCSASLTKVAFEIERRHNAAMPYPAAEDDLDTAIALHNEAWLMSGWYST